MHEGKAVGAAEIIHNCLSPLSSCSSIIWSCTTPIPTIMVIIGFSYRFERKIIFPIFTAHMAPGQIISSSSAVITGNGVSIRIIIIIVIAPIKNRYPERVPIIIDPWPRVGNLIILSFRRTAEFPMEIDLIPGSAEIIFSQFQDAYHTVRFGITGTDRDNSGFLFNNVNFCDHFMRLGSRKQFHIDIFKKSQVIKPFHTPACRKLIEGLSFFITKFPEDDIVLCFFIAFNGDIFHDTFCNIDFQNSIGSHLNIRNRIQKIPLLQVQLFNFLQLLSQQSGI